MTSDDYFCATEKGPFPTRVLAAWKPEAFQGERVDGDEDARA
jgi:hypothetical protein